MGKRNFVLLENNQKTEMSDDTINVSSGAVIAEIQEVEGFDPALLINLDFRGRPDLLEAVRSLADSQFRSAQQQIMFILNEFCSEFIYDRGKKE